MARAISVLDQMEHTINYSQSRNTENCLLRILYDCDNFSPKNECYGCKNLDKYENEIELGYNSPCTSCKRRAQDNFEEEKR
jgi:hypothetical protein